MKYSIPVDQRLFRQFRLYVVTVLIENRGRSLYLSMIVDTAASYATVRPDVFEQLEIRPARTQTLITASERMAAPMGQVDRVTVGSGCAAAKVPVMSIALPAALPAEELLGASFLKNFEVLLNYRTGILELTGGR